MAIFRRFFSCVAGLDPAFSKCKVLPFCSIDNVSGIWQLTGNEGHRLQSVPPVIRDLNLRLSLSFILNRVTHFPSVSDKLLAVFVLDCIQHVEKVLATGHTILGHFVRKVLHKRFISLHKWPEVNYAELVI